MLATGVDIKVIVDSVNHQSMRLINSKTFAYIEIT